MDVEDLLRQNLERQRVLKEGLKRSKQDILRIQEDTRKGGDDGTEVAEGGC